MQSCVSTIVLDVNARVGFDKESGAELVPFLHCYGQSRSTETILKVYPRVMFEK